MIYFILFLFPVLSFAADGNVISGTNQIDISIVNDFYLTSEAIADGVSYGNVIGEYRNSSSAVDWDTYNSDLSSFLGGSWDVNQVDGMDGWGSSVMQSAPLEAYSSLNFSNIQRHANDIGLGSFFASNGLNFDASQQPNFSVSTNIGAFSDATGYRIPILSSNSFGAEYIDADSLYFDFRQVPGMEFLGNVDIGGSTTLHSIGTICRYSFIIVRGFAFFLGCVSLWGVARDAFA